MADDITLKTVLDHVVAMEGRISKRFDMVDQRFARVDERFVSMNQRFDTVERKINILERNLTAQIDGIDKRLDEVEIENLPKRVATVEAALAL